MSALLATPAIADVTFTSQVTGKAGESQSITYIKGLKMRTDLTLPGTPTTTIIDLETQRFIGEPQEKGSHSLRHGASRQDLDKSMKTGASRRR